jgi:ribosomal protein L9
MEQLVAARDEAAQALAEAKQQLESEQAAAAAAKAAAAALEQRLGDLTAQVGASIRSFGPFRWYFINV